jgi:hypothetical protein
MVMNNRPLARLAAAWGTLASRRGALVALGSGALGSVLTGNEPEAVEAKGKKKCECLDDCTKGIRHDCQRTDLCGLVKKVSGGTVCINRECGDRCSKNSDCESGLCVIAPGCCMGGKFCAEPCNPVIMEPERTARSAWRQR